jgi:hypothetical protein
MRSIIYRVGVAVALAGSLGAFACNVHDNVLNVEDPRVNFDTDVDTDNVEQGQQINVSIDVEEATMVAPEDDVPAGTETAVFVEIHLDDVSNTALLVTAEASATVTIPADTSPGKHKLICQVKDHDTKEPTGQESTIDINVKASASTTQ